MGRNSTLIYKALPAVITGILVTSAVIFAWQEATCDPPNCNVSAPVNVSGTGQFKTGDLGVATNALDTLHGLTVGSDANRRGIKVIGDSFFQGSTNNNSAAVFNAANFATTSILYVRNDGNVGIGTTTPVALLHINGSNDAGIANNLALGNNGASANSRTAIYMGYQLAGLGLYGARILQTGTPTSLRSGDLSFQIHNTIASNADAAWDTPLFIQRTTGNVGIGTTGPTIKLAIGDTDTGLHWISDGNLAVYTNNLERIRIDSSGNVGIGITPSGAKLEVAGQIKITGGSPAAGKILTSDAAGLASWQTPSVVAPIDATFITQTPSATLTSEQALSTLPTGYMKLTTGTGVVSSQAVPISVSDGGTGRITLTAGNVLFGAGTGAVGLDADLFWDNTNKRLGIGTTGPTIKLAIGDTDTGLHWISDGNLAVYTNNLERIRIDSSGNVGIGTTGPNARLDIKSGNDNIAFFNNGDNRMAIQSYIDGHWSDRATYAPSETRLLLQPDGGNVGIGVAPDQKLVVAGLIKSTNNGAAYFQGGDDATLNDVNVANTVGIYGIQDSTKGCIRLGSGASDICGSSGNVGIGTTGPTIKLAVGDSDTGLGWTGDGQLNIYSNNENAISVRNRNVGIGNLAGTGTRSVTVDASGVLGTGVASGGNSFYTSIGNVDGLICAGDNDGNNNCASKDDDRDSLHVWRARLGINTRVGNTFRLIDGAVTCSVHRTGDDLGGNLLVKDVKIIANRIFSGGADVQIDNNLYGGVRCTHVVDPINDGHNDSSCTFNIPNSSFSMPAGIGYGVTYEAIIQWTCEYSPDRGLETPEMSKNAFIRYIWEE